MLACVDVDYRGDEAVAACLVFRSVGDAAASARHVARTSPVVPYRPGHFYKRELPPLLAVLHEVETPLEIIFVDGYAWLGPQKKGLGAELWEALERKVAVVGVAKTAYAGAEALAVRRGVKSTRPLYVTAAGIEPDVAAAMVAQLHGEARIPTLLKAVDRLSREA